MAAATDQIMATTDPSSPSMITVITTATTLTTPTTSPQEVTNESNKCDNENSKRKCSVGSMTIDSLTASSSSSSLGSINAATTFSPIDHHSISLKLAPGESKASIPGNTNNVNTNNTASINNISIGKPMVSTTTQMACTKHAQKVLPFESIKTKLEQNNVPDAEFIQRHIDNLISHNEAIIDSWNLMNVRPCSTSTTSGNVTSNNSLNCKPSSPSPSSSNRSHNRSSLVDSSTTQCPLDERPSSSHGTSNKNLSAWPSMTASNHQRLPASRSRKRWSTTALSGLQQLNQHPSIDLGNNSLNVTPMSHQNETQRGLNGTHFEWSQNLHASQQPSFQFKHSPNFESPLDPYRVSSLQHLPGGSSSDLGSPLLLSGHQQSSCLRRSSNSFDTAPFIQQANFLSSAPIPNSSQHTTASTANISASEIQRIIDLHRAQQVTEGQLESAIQNLSLKRREEDLRQQQKQLNHEHQIQMMLQNQAILNQGQESAGFNLSNLTSDGAFYVPMALMNHNNRASNIDPNMLDNPNVVAALINERQRQIQSLIESGTSTGLNVFNSTQELSWQKQNCQQGAPDNLSAVALDAQQSSNLDRVQNKYRNLSTPVAPNVSQLRPRRQQHPFLNGLDPTLISQIIATMCEEKSDSRQHSLNQTSFTSGAQMPTVSHSDRSELLDRPLDSATPTHRCDTCDIAFWTRDLLNYHKLTQCVVGDNSATSTNKPLAYNFTGPNNYELLNQQMQQNLEDQTAQTHSPLGLANRGKACKSVSPPRSRCTLEKLSEISDSKDGNQQQELLNPYKTTSSTSVQANESTTEDEEKKMDELSILKQQLLQSNNSTGATQSGLVIAPESLPLKKRKISEPNMRYRTTKA